MKQEQKQSQHKPRLALITTKKHRSGEQKGDFHDFIYSNLEFLSQHFEVLTTGGTYEEIKGVLDMHFRQVSVSARERIQKARMLNDPLSSSEYGLWASRCASCMKPHERGVAGMIQITRELVEQRLDAVLHFTDWEDTPGKADTAVLRREANVHDVPIAGDIATGEEFISSWRSCISRERSLWLQTNPEGFLRKRTPEASPLKRVQLKSSGNTPRVIALIAHDAKKLDLCCFFTRNLKLIKKRYDYVLATGHTADWLKRFAIAAAPESSREIERMIVPCHSGPRGGDVQIAAAVVENLCQKVVFFQDPHSSHPHESDIRLFEQSILLFTQLKQRVKNVQLAINEASASQLL